LPVKLGSLTAFDDVSGLSAIIPLGSLEQHCRLPVGLDCMIAERLSELAASRAEGILGRSPAYAIAPPICYGFSPEWAGVRGTISLRAHTIIALLEDVIEGLARWGFDPIIILNAHGGNTPVARAAAVESSRLSGARVALIDYWRASGLQLGHACRVEESIALDLGLIESPPSREGCAEAHSLENAVLEGPLPREPAWMPGGEPAPLDSIIEALARKLVEVSTAPKDRYILG